MAKQVQPLEIILGIKGAEKLAALKSSFRDLTKTVKQSDADIESARKSINDYVKSANNSEAVIRGQIKAFEGLREQAAMGGKVYSELGNQIKQLKADLRGSTDAVEEQRISLVKTGQAAKGSASDIQSVVTQLEQLQKSARPGSSAFAQLSKDIAVLKSQLKEANVEVKKFNVGFEIGQRPAMSLERIQRQIGRLTEGLKGLNFVSNDFLNVQQRIALLGQVQSATIGRQQVIAREQMFSSAAFETFAAGPAGSLQLPKTAAALNLEIGELQERLANTVPGETYANLTVEIANKQRELQRILTGTADAYDRVAAAQDRSARVAQKVAGIQEYQASTGGLAPGVGGYRDPATGAIIARGAGNIADRRVFNAARAELANAIAEGAIQQARILALPAAGQTTALGTGAAMSGGAVPLRGTRGPLQPIVGLPTDLRTVGGRRQRPAGVEAEVNDRARRSYISQTEAIRKNTEAKEAAARVEANYRAEIDKATKANIGSINSSNRLRSALEAYRSTLPATSKEFANLTKQINDLDRKSEAVSRRMGRRRMSPMQMTQAAGAAISGGIFGGPEGFLGGVGGALVGGVGGAFAGAAFGAQVGGLRRTLGGYSEYAAQIERLKIALGGIAGPQEEYNRALAAANSVTKDLSVPQEVAIQGITRLTAAVKGAGGGVADAELAFKNINSAIIATGGGAEQVEGAVTALVQIFSKGKVSAEEINQIAERLPGTFNKIAAASGRTGPELTKALQDGKVGLNDLMKFLISLGDEYGALALKIAASSENAGARLQIAYNNMRIEVGKALQPIGAEFQDAFTEFIEDITPALVASLPVIAQAFKTLAQVVLEVAKLISTAFSGMFGEIERQGKESSERIQGLFRSVGNFFSRIAKFMSQQWQFRIGEIIINASGGNAQIKKIIKSLGDFWKETVDFMGKYWGKFVEYAVNAFAGALTGPVQIVLQKAGINLGEIAAASVSAFGGGPSTPEPTEDSPELPSGLSDFPDPGLNGGGNGSGAGGRTASAIRNATNQALALRERLSRLIRDAALDFAGLGVSAEDAIDAKYNKAVAAAMDQTADLRKQIEELSAVTGDGYSEMMDMVDQYGFALEKVARKQRDLALEELSNKRFSEMLKNYGFSGDVDVSGKIFSSITSQEFPTGVDSILQPNKLTQNIEELRTSLQSLVEPLNQITNAANAIGDAFATSFVDVISGATTAKQALADFFQSVGSYFLDMAKQIIAQMIQIAILNSVAKLLPGLGSSGSTGFNLNGMGQAFAPGGSMPFPMRANGGPVTSGSPYIVGERGPELFIPFQSGRVASNEDTQQLLGQASTVQLPFTRNAETASAMQSSSEIKVKYESTVVNGVEYVTAEQHRKGMAQAAERGRALALSSLQNSVKARKLAGI